jgi:hypothetical protein
MNETSATYAEIEYILRNQLVPARLTIALLQTQANSQDGPLKAASILYKIIERLLDLTAFLLTPDMDVSTEKTFQTAAGYCQSVQLMIKAVGDWVGGRIEESQDAATLAMQQFAEIGMYPEER